MKRAIICLLTLVLLGLAGHAAWAQETEQKVKLDQLSAPVKKAIQNAVGKGKLIDIGKISSNGTTTYEIEIRLDGKEIDIVFDSQGKVLDRNVVTEKVADKVTEKDADKGAKKVADTGSNKDSDKVSKKGTKKVVDKVVDKLSIKNAEKDADKVADKVANGKVTDDKKSVKFQHEFDLEHRNLSTTGRNRYFILEPGYQLILEGKDAADDARLEITVLNKTKDIGKIETRVVEERETVNGQLVEVSRNFFAICKQTNSVFYFGEEVDIYRDEKVVGHAGAWLHGQDNASAGMMIPGECLVGAAYYQEYAPKKAMDRARIEDVSATIKTPAGKFSNCLKVWEENPLDGDSETKTFAPGIGLVQDEGLLLVKHGFIKK